MASSRLLGDLSALQLSAELSKDSIVVLPLGAIEQHGPHLPLNTDFVVADAVSRAAVEKFGAETNAWLLPTLPFTKSNEHAWAAGTMWLSATTMMSVIDDIGRCVAATPAKKIMFINGHGGNSALMAMMNRELRLKYGLQTFLAHPHMPADQGGSSAESELGMGVHGGVDETSVMLHLRPDLVDMTLAVRRVPEGLAKNEQVKFGGRVAFGWLSNDFFREGHIGDPTGASTELGARMFA
ncbi:MAG: creatininase family protein, partial [Actinobacteria bacterium]|nr:creatininase family protein [Actinomycetota bacterium]